jgi:PST family polysaccharide transporter
MMGRFLRNTQVEHVIPVAGFSLFVAAFGTVPGTLLSRDMRFRENATAEWLGTLTNSIIAISLAWNGFSFWSIVYGHVANDLVRSAAKLRFARWRPRLSFSLTAVRELFSFGAGVYAKYLLDYLGNNLDSLLVGRILGANLLGYYDKAFNVVSRTVARINMAGPSVSFRIFSLIHEEPGRFHRAYRKVVLSVTVLGYPILTFLIFTAPELIHLLFGSRWMASVVPFQILCLAGMLRLLNEYASTASQATGVIWSEVRRHCVSTVFLVVGVATLCTWGIQGAAVGVLLATVVKTFLMQGLLHRVTALRWRDLIEPQVPAIVCSLGMALVMTITRAAVYTYAATAASWTLLLVATTVGGLYYFAFVLFAGFQELRHVVSETLDDLAPSAARRLKALRTATSSVYF